MRCTYIRDLTVDCYGTTHPDRVGATELHVSAELFSVEEFDDFSPDLGEVLVDHILADCSVWSVWDDIAGFDEESLDFPLQKHS